MLLRGRLHCSRLLSGRRLLSGSRGWLLSRSLLIFTNGFLGFGLWCRLCLLLFDLLVMDYLLLGLLLRRDSRCVSASSATLGKSEKS